MGSYSSDADKGEAAQQAVLDQYAPEPPYAGSSSHAMFYAPMVNRSNGEGTGNGSPDEFTNEEVAGLFEM